MPLTTVAVANVVDSDDWVTWMVILKLIHGSIKDNVKSRVTHIISAGSLKPGFKLFNIIA